MAANEIRKKKVIPTKLHMYLWEGRDKSGKIVKSTIRAPSEAVAKTTLRRQGIAVTKVKRQLFSPSGTVSAKDISVFTRQLATMMRAGVPLLQSFDIVGRGHANPAVSKLLLDIKADVEGGSSLSQAFRKYPLYFDSLYCNLVAAGEQGGILEALLDRLATYKEKVEAVKRKIKSALFYPVSVLVVAFVVTAVIMIFVIPAFKEVFSNFGAELPGPTLTVIAISDFTVANWYILFPAIIGAVWGFLYFWKRSKTMQNYMDRISLKAPIFGKVIRQAVIARWTRTMATLFSAGIPLVESLETVAGASGNHVYEVATNQIQSKVATGTSLTVAMQMTNLFDNMVIQMTAIGEESGSIDGMLNKVADFYEDEVDNAVAAISSLMEPLMIVILGIIIGGLVIAMYLPIFKLGAVV